MFREPEIDLNKSLGNLERKYGDWWIEQNFEETFSTHVLLPSDLIIISQIAKKKFDIPKCDIWPHQLCHKLKNETIINIWRNEFCLFISCLVTILAKSSTKILSTMSLILWTSEVDQMLIRCWSDIPLSDFTK